MAILRRRRPVQTAPPEAPVDRRHDTETRDRIADLEEFYRHREEVISRSMLHKWVAIIGLYVMVFIAVFFLWRAFDRIQVSRVDNFLAACEIQNSQNSAIVSVLS